MSKIEETIELVKKKAEEYGASTEDEYTRSYVFRENINQDALKHGGAYFGFISPDEEESGPYHDLSVVLFPGEDLDKPWVLALTVGTLGFKNDYELANLPGLRRLYSSLIDEDGYCKTSIADIDQNLPLEFRYKVPHLRDTLDTYKKVLPVTQIIDDPTSKAGKERILAFLAAYARISEWPTNQSHRDAVSDAISKVAKTKRPNDEENIQELVNKRRFVILQGPPGTGKTLMAKKVANNIGTKIFFTQFYAQTDYSDFIYGIRPDLNKEEVSYKPHKGIFYTSLKYAVDNPDEEVVLIIDEINRANLSNILGPIFYLFEYKPVDTSVEIKVGGEFTVSKIPDNYYVIGTMNTADRSLAVVDFALRRRFSWYTLSPRPLDREDFHKEEFNKLHQIFQMYATSEELNLEPGQAYFIAEDKEEMKNRLRYDILPLIKEYLTEGLLVNARERFAEYFHEEIGEQLFE